MDPRFRCISSAEAEVAEVGVDGAKQKERWEDYLRYSFSGHRPNGFLPDCYLVIDFRPRGMKVSAV